MVKVLKHENIHYKSEIALFLIFATELLDNLFEVLHDGGDLFKLQIGLISFSIVIFIILDLFLTFFCLLLAFFLL